jgi:hypothetical protein
MGLTVNRFGSICGDQPARVVQLLIHLLQQCAARLPSQVSAPMFCIHRICSSSLLCLSFVPTWRDV